MCLLVVSAVIARGPTCFPQQHGAFSRATHGWILVILLSLLAKSSLLSHVTQASHAVRVSVFDSDLAVLIVVAAGTYMKQSRGLQPLKNCQLDGRFISGCSALK